MVGEGHGGWEPPFVVGEGHRGLGPHLVVGKGHGEWRPHLVEEQERKESGHTLSMVPME